MIGTVLRLPLGDVQMRSFGQAVEERAAPRGGRWGAANVLEEGDKLEPARRSAETGTLRLTKQNTSACRYENHSIECGLWCASINGLNYFQSGSSWHDRWDDHWIDIQAKVEGADAVGKGAYGDEVDTCGGNVADEVQGNAAAGFGQRPAVDPPDGGAKIVDGKVVEENRVDVGGEHCVDLVEAIDFDFEVCGVRDYCAQGEQGVGERGRRVGGKDREVVILSHDGV